MGYYQFNPINNWVGLGHILVGGFARENGHGLILPTRLNPWTALGINIINQNQKLIQLYLFHRVTKLHANSSVKKYFEAARFIHLAWYSHTQHVSIVLFKGIALFGIVYLDTQNTLKFICF